MTAQLSYDAWKCTEPVPEYPDAPDAHEQCERDIARLEGEVEAARRAPPRTLSFVELHALVGALVGDTTYAITVQTWRHHVDARLVTTWAVSWFPDNADAKSCRRFEGPTAAAAYEQLRAVVPANPLDEVGDLPW